MKQTKKPYLSKTLWINAIIAILALLGQVQIIPFFQDPNYIAIAVAVVNGLLRLVTDKKIQLLD